jgi:hypothetical protein
VRRGLPSTLISAPAVDENTPSRTLFRPYTWAIQRFQALPRQGAIRESAGSFEYFQFFKFRFLESFYSLNRVAAYLELRFLASSALPGTDYRSRAVKFMAERMVRNSKNKCLSPFY